MRPSSISVAISTILKVLCWNEPTGLPKSCPLLAIFHGHIQHGLGHGLGHDARNRAFPPGAFPSGSRSPGPPRPSRFARARGSPRRSAPRCPGCASHLLRACARGKSPGSRPPRRSGSRPCARLVSVLAATMTRSRLMPLEMKVFWPLITYRSRRGRPSSGSPPDRSRYRAPSWRWR